MLNLSPQNSYLTVKSVRAYAYRIVMLQLLVVLVVSFVWLVVGRQSALSALMGGAAAVLPSLYFARRFFTSIYAREVKRIIRAFYWGEIVKLGLMGLLVVAITRSYQVELLPFFCGFASAQFGFWLSLAVMQKF